MNNFVKPELEIITFYNEDIIVTSGQAGNECEPWDLNNPNCP